MPTASDYLQGAWAISSLKMDGRAVPAPAYTGALITITGNRFTSAGMGAVYEGTVRIVEPVAPVTHGHIDLRFDTGPEAGNTNRGLFEITPTGWRLCLATARKKRPTSFEAPPDTGIILETLIRPAARPDQSRESVSAAPPPYPDASTGTGTELEGTWAMVTGIVDGVPMASAMAQWVRRVTTGSETVVSAGPQVLMKFTVETDPAADPKAIDYHHTAGPNKGTTQAGIYKLETGLLTIHMAPPGSSRPADFELSAGGKSSLTTWIRHPPSNPRA